MTKIICGACNLRTFDLVGVDIKDQYSAALDGFAIEETEDCVCRGGVCPRRYGCPFWVERMTAQSKLYYEASESLNIQNMTSKTNPQLVTSPGKNRTSNSIPIEVQNTGDAACAILEVCIGGQKDRVESINGAATSIGIVYYDRENHNQSTNVINCEDTGDSAHSILLSTSSKPPLG
eukprot:CAMPEP_0174997814 /NCGR_PEP_ID=MMETSP0005-20121125/1155_1 /TAXON_ID=420556 /ORGANISM="Ochromonas sp., Strain CCMP1393" /LENGTH=176 /DNA_ID=CAMNT_0016252367 /DNA_START=425 /DNA_END=952 /DNA_ORIENTATION=-